MSVANVIKTSGISSQPQMLAMAMFLNSVRRCQTLPIVGEYSVGNHVLNCLFLVDFLANNSYIVPRDGSVPCLSEKDVGRVKLYLQYHDVEEALVGDIPYHAALELPQEFRKNVRSEMAWYGFKMAMDFDGRFNDMHKSVADVIDVLEFVLFMSNQPTTGHLGFRNAIALEEGEKLLDERIRNNKYYKFELDTLLEAWDAS